MRYYDIEFNLATSQKADKLEVAGLQREIYGSGESYDNKLHFRLDESNPYALRVTFNIQHFGDAGTYIPSVLTIYNPPTAFFTCADALVGSTVTFKAGLKSSIYTKKLDLTLSNNDTLYIGNVARVVPNYVGKEPSVAILLGSFIDIKGVSCIEALEKGGKVGEYIKKVLLKLYPSLSVTIAESAESVTLEDKQTYQSTFSSLNEITAFADGFKLKLAVSSNKVVIYNPSQGGFSNADSFIPKSQDFLSQPEMQNLTDVQCVFALRGDLQLSQKILFNYNLAMNGGSLMDDSNALAGFNNNNAIITSGEYTITGIWHTGDSRNSSAEAWATTISATKPENNAASGGS